MGSGQSGGTKKERESEADCVEDGMECRCTKSASLTLRSKAKFGMGDKVQKAQCKGIEDAKRRNARTKNSP
jgi:hypothetical protein